MPDPQEITLVVLAGGEGSRMGRPKAWLDVGGRPILDCLADCLAWPGPTLLVTAPGREHPPGAERFDAEACDPAAGLGPLRGLLTALEHGTTPLLVAATVDMPFVRIDHLAWLAAALARHPEANGILTSRTGSGGVHVEPFPCALRSQAKGAIAAHLAGGRRAVHSLLARDGFAALAAPADWDETVWTNLNTPADWEAFLIAGAGGDVPP